jgi:hypothetical protein
MCSKISGVELIKAGLGFEMALSKWMLFRPSKELFTPFSNKKRIELILVEVLQEEKPEFVLE